MSTPQDNELSQNLEIQLNFNITPEQMVEMYKEEIQKWKACLEKQKEENEKLEEQLKKKNEKITILEQEKADKFLMIRQLKKEHNHMKKGYMGHINIIDSLRKADMDSIMKLVKEKNNLKEDVEMLKSEVEISDRKDNNLKVAFERSTKEI